MSFGSCGCNGCLDLGTRVLALERVVVFCMSFILIVTCSGGEYGLDGASVPSREHNKSTVCDVAADGRFGTAAYQACDGVIFHPILRPSLGQFGETDITRSTCSILRVRRCLLGFNGDGDVRECSAGVEGVNADLIRKQAVDGALVRTSVCVECGGIKSGLQAKRSVVRGYVCQAIDLYTKLSENPVRAVEVVASRNLGGVCRTDFSSPLPGVPVPGMQCRLLPIPFSKIHSLYPGRKWYFSSVGSPPV